jgi:hypothetical protein
MATAQGNVDKRPNRTDDVIISHCNFLPSCAPLQLSSPSIPSTVCSFKCGNTVFVANTAVIPGHMHHSNGSCSAAAAARLFSTCCCCCS